MIYGYSNHKGINNGIHGDIFWKYLNYQETLLNILHEPEHSNGSMKENLWLTTGKAMGLCQ